jgi:hypothetical protein
MLTFRMYFVRSLITDSIQRLQQLHLHLMFTLVELFGVLPDLSNRVKLLGFRVLRIKDIVQHTYKTAPILEILHS